MSPLFWEEIYVSILLRKGTGTDLHGPYTLGNIISDVKEKEKKILKKSQTTRCEIRQTPLESTNLKGTHHRHSQ